MKLHFQTCDIPLQSTSQILSANIPNLSKELKDWYQRSVRSSISKLNLDLQLLHLGYSVNPARSLKIMIKTHTNNNSDDDVPKITFPQCTIKMHDMVLIFKMETPMF